MRTRNANLSPGCLKKLKSRGYRLTVGRGAILDALAHAAKGEHLSAEDIYHKVHDNFPTIGLTSVYRTLDILINLGMVCKFDFGDGRARYELSEDHSGVKHHHHLVCTDCGRIVNYEDFIDEELSLLKRTEDGLKRKYGFQITSHVMQFHGLCPDCQAREVEPS